MYTYTHIHTRTHARTRPRGGGLVYGRRRMLVGMRVHMSIRVRIRRVSMSVSVRVGVWQAACVRGAVDGRRGKRRDLAAECLFDKVRQHKCRRMHLRGVAEPTGMRYGWFG